MTPEQIEMVQSTWAQVVPIADKAAELFYGKLFELDPELKPLFKGDMTEQGQKLMKTINVAVSSLNDLGAIVPTVQELGRNHVGYGVKAKDYDTVAAALIWTLSQGLGDAFTDEVKEAWVLTYTTLANVMKDAAEEVAA
jgi:hemoglobin-like flavoprotein